MEVLTMSQKEVEQINVFERLQRKEMKQKEAAKMLRLSVRQIRRKLKEFCRIGPRSLIHKLRDAPSNNQFDPELGEKALGLITEKYADFGPTFAAEKLLEIHGIRINRETLRKKMIVAKLWQPKQKKVTHRQWRERKECLGELVQLDGSDHDWFEGRAPKCDLLAFIDDATSNTLQLEFAAESTRGVMGATKHYIEKHGLPHELYADRGKVYKVNLGNEDNSRLTQYGRAMEEFDVGLTHARSPQAKGRVERLFGTLQDRLVKEMRLRDISTIEEANRFIEEEYLPKHNQKYAVAPRSSTNLHRSAKNYDLDDILCIKEERILTSDFTLRYKNQWFQLEKSQKTLIFPKDRITVITHLTGEVRLMIRDTKIFFHQIGKPAIKEKIKTNIQEARKPWVPPVDHPWREYDNIKKQKADISTLQKEDILTLV